MAGAVELEVRTSLVQLLAVWRKEQVVAVRVDYRPVGTRNWSHFNLIPEPGQSVERLVAHAQLAAQMVHARGGPDAAALDREQLLGVAEDPETAA